MSDKPKPIKVQSDAPVTKTENPDGSVSMTSEGPVSLHIDSIRAVGIENLVDVESHTINRVFNSVSHLVKFYGGGEVRFSYNAQGEILEFSASNVDAHIANGDRIVLRRRPGSADKPG